ncbi:MAG: hypothetical protein ACUVRV_00640 [Cyanobacteriota bacterium]
MNWTVFALFYAEEKGITSANLGEFLNSEDSNIFLRFLGQDGNLGAVLGLEPDWAVNVTKSVGNYSKIFDRHLRGWPVV